MIDKIKSFFDRLDDTFCFIKPGNYEKDCRKIEGEIHFIDHTLFIAPKTPCFDLRKVKQLEKNIIAGFERHLKKEIYFNPTCRIRGEIEMWVYGFGFIRRHKEMLPPLRPVGRKTEPEMVIHTTEIMIYPHLDLARTAMLYDFNPCGIDLQDLEYYKLENTYGVVEHRGFCKPGIEPVSDPVERKGPDGETFRLFSIKIERYDS